MPAAPTEPNPRSTLARRAALALAALALATLALAARADAYIYWTGNGTITIGRVNLDGTDFDELHPRPRRPLTVAVDGNHIYWNDLYDEIGKRIVGRANLDGTDADQNLITGTLRGGDRRPHLYWSRDQGIVRANLDGTNVGQTSSAPRPARPGWRSTTATSTGRTGPRDDRARQPRRHGRPEPHHRRRRPLLGGADNGYIYWANVESHDGRANLDGTDVSQGFIPGTAPTGWRSRHLHLLGEPTTPT